MLEKVIRTLHPQGKSGKKISLEKYEAMRKAILSALSGKNLTHAELFAELESILLGKFDGNISWYGETVKLDLEARKVIARTQDKPQKYYLL